MNNARGIKLFASYSARNFRGRVLFFETRNVPPFIRVLYITRNINLCADTRIRRENNFKFTTLWYARCYLSRFSALAYLERAEKETVPVWRGFRGGGGFNHGLLKFQTYNRGRWTGRWRLSRTTYRRRWFGIFIPFFMEFNYSNSKIIQMSFLKYDSYSEMRFWKLAPISRLHVFIQVLRYVLLYFVFGILLHLQSCSTR